MSNKPHGIERVALSTGQASQYCFVSPGTILNWIRSGRLPCQRTAGGQFRIRADHLRAFMLEQGMSVEALDNDCCLSRRCFCWEYFARSKDHASHDDCMECIVHKSRSMNCFELRGRLEHKGVHCKTSCEECRYRRAYAEEIEAESEQAAGRGQ